MKQETFKAMSRDVTMVTIGEVAIATRPYARKKLSLAMKRFWHIRKNIVLVAIFCCFPATAQANPTEGDVHLPAEEQERNGDAKRGSSAIFTAPSVGASSATMGGASRTDPFEESEDAQQSNSIIFTPPSVGIPSATTGGGTRDSSICQQPNVGDAPLTPIAPPGSLGLTAAERPVFFAFIPEISDSKGLFVLVDEEGELLHQTEVELRDRAGIIRLSLPDEVPPLEVGKDYNWSFILVCGGELRPDAPSVRGTVRRVETDPSLEAAELSLEQAAALAKAGIWYDTVSVLAELRRLSPDDENLKAQWQALLESQGLERVAEAAILRESPTQTEAESSGDTTSNNSEPARQRGTFNRPNVGIFSRPRRPGGTR